MHIQSLKITDTKNTNFKSKDELFKRFFNAKKVNDRILQINRNKDAKELFQGLSTIAISAIAGLTLTVENNESAKEFFRHVLKDLGYKHSDWASAHTEIKNDDTIQESQINQNEALNIYDKLVEEVPERALYLKITSYFPMLDLAYKNLLQAKLNDPENEEKISTLSIVENVFDYLSKQDRLMNTKSYFNILDKNAECLDKIAVNLSSTLKNGNSIMYYLVLLNNGKLNQEDINLWAKADNLSCDEFMMLKNMGENIILNLNNIKKQHNNNFKLIDFSVNAKNEGSKTNNCYYKLNFNSDIDILERLNIVKDVHKSIFGDICFQNKKDYKSEYVEQDIQRELLDNIVKDRRMDATYTFVKYINPKALKNFNITTQDVKFLQKDSKIYKEISKICKEEIVNLDYENPKLKEFGEVMRDDSLFNGLFETNHAKMRFITRFVLKNNPNPQNLHESCKQKMNIFMKELVDNSDKCNYSCYIHTKGFAPQFYLRKSQLGNYIKITLNSEGKIHTMYEDIRKELQDKNSKDT